MGFFRKDDQEYHVSKLHNALEIAFDHVKKDTSHIFNWLSFFHGKHKEHDERLAKIESQMQVMPKSHQEIKQIVDYYYSYEHILNKMQELSSRLDSIEQQKQEKKVGIKERLIKKITRNSKDYVKTVIISLVKKYSKITAPQLKEMLVEEQGLCSKSSFYRLLAELELEGQLESIQLGKEKAYMSKTAVEN
jgi:hypothetical protein